MEIVEISDDEPLAPAGPSRLANPAASQRPKKPLPSRAAKDGGRSNAEAITAPLGPPSQPLDIATPDRDSLALQVLEIVPDVAMNHLMEIIDGHLEQPTSSPLAQILHALFEDPNYPKQSNGARKRNADQDDLGQTSNKARKIDINYLDIDRPHEGSSMYGELALNQLMSDFPLMPKPFIRKVLFEMRGFYAPTHFHLLEEQAKPSGRYKIKGTKSKVPAKTKVVDPLFLSERDWVEQKLVEDAVRRDQEAAESIDEAENGGIDCGCCFTTHPFVRFIRLPH